MRIQIGLLATVGLFGLFATANAQGPAPSAAAMGFDGTYRLVSSARVNPTYMSQNGHMGQCPDRRPGPLHIAGGHAHYMTATGYRMGGTVGPQGQLALQMEAAGGARTLAIKASGGIDGRGSVHVRQVASSCSYDFVWQKRSK